MRGRKRLFNDKEKWCNKCEKWLPLDAFGENKRTASGKQDYCKTCHNSYGGTFWGKVQAYDALLAAKYNMKPNDYLELWRSQNKQCAICGAALALYNRGTHLHVFGQVKKLLCTSCDKGLDNFKENPEFLLNAAEQLNKFAKVTSNNPDDGGEKNPGADTSSKDDNQTGAKQPL
jgi:hypothetical protein